MITEIDEALRTAITTRAKLGNDIDIVFDAPTKDWASRRNAPTVNVYLYDVREDLRRRETGLIDRRDEHGVVIARVPAPRHFKLSYLVSAWTQRPEDEHRILDQLLSALLAIDAFGPDVLTGALAGSGIAVPISVGLPPPEDRAFADVWSALGGELKPSLDIVVTAPMLAGTAQDAGPPVTEQPIGRFSIGSEIAAVTDEETRQRPRAATR